MSPSIGMPAHLDAFWPPLGSDPVLDDLYRAAGYRVLELPLTALELLDRLRQIGYRIGKLKDLDLQDPGSVGRWRTVDGDTDESVRLSVSTAVDGGLDVQGAVDRLHEGSSRCDEGAGTPDDRTVEDAADKAVGVGRVPLGPADPSAGGAR